MNETLLQVACPHCHAVNRVPAMRLAEDTARQLHNPVAYLEAVLTAQEGTK